MGWRPADYYKYLMVAAHGPFEEVEWEDVEPESLWQRFVKWWMRWKPELF